MRGTYADDCEHTSCIIFVVITLYVASRHKALLDSGKITFKGKAWVELVTRAYAGLQMISELLKSKKEMSFYVEMVTAWANAMQEWSRKHLLGEELVINVGNEMLFSYCYYGLLCLHFGTSIEVFDERIYGPYTVRDKMGAAASQLELPPKLVISLMFSVLQLKLCTEPAFISAHPLPQHLLLVLKWEYVMAVWHRAMMHRGNVQAFSEALLKLFTAMLAAYCWSNLIDEVLSILISCKIIFFVYQLFSLTVSCSKSVWLLSNLNWLS